MNRLIALIVAVAASCFGQNTSVINLGGAPKKDAPVPLVTKVKTSPVTATEVPLVVVKEVAPVPAPVAVAKVEQPTIKVVLELLTGERIDGMLQTATASDVRMNVAGEPLTISMSKVRAVYVGEAPKVAGAVPATPSKVVDALQALQALTSVTTAGVNRRDYAPRVHEAKVKVDQYLSDPPSGDPSLRENIRLAMRFHEEVLKSWGQSGYHAELEASLIELKTTCPFIDESLNAFKVTSPRLAQISETALVDTQPSIFWTCAAKKTAEAKRILDQK